MPETDVRPAPIATPSGRRGRRHGIEIKAGSVKQARKEAGLSLAQVANGAVSRTAIYFVEVGKAKPSMETLMLIAERTGRPLDYFLAQPSTLEPRSSPQTLEIELLMATNDLQGALATGRALLAGELDPETKARAQELCRTLRPVPETTEARLLFVLGSVHVTNEDWPAAIDCYEKAISAGAVVQDLRRLSLMYGGLSLAYKETGELNQASYYAQRAISIHETLNDRLSLARSENNLALLLVKRGELEAAGQHLNRSLALFDEAAVETGRDEILLSLCEMEIARSRLDAAETYAVEARTYAERLNERATLADSHQWLGRIAAERGDHDRVDSEFREAWGILDALGAEERLSRCHVTYAELLEKRGDLAAANRQLRLALNRLHPAKIAPPAQLERTATA